MEYNNLPTIEEYAESKRFIEECGLYEKINSYTKKVNFNDIKIDVYKRKHKYEFEDQGMLDSKYLNLFIGASQVASLLVPEESFSNPKNMLLEKLNIIRKINTKQMILGRIFEEYLKDLLTYFDKDADSILENKLKGNRIREVAEIQNTYIVFINDVPIRVTPDFSIKIEDKDIPVDTKFVNRISFNKKEMSMLPGQYVWQSIMQQLAMNTDFGLLFYLIANEDVVIQKIDLNEYLPFITTVSQNVDDFYKNVIDANTKARDEVINNYYTEYSIKLSGYEVDNENVIYSNETYYENADDIAGDDQDYTMAVEYIKNRELKTEYEQKMESIKNNFRVKYPSHKNVICEDYIVVLKDRFNIKPVKPLRNQEL